MRKPDESLDQYIVKPTPEVTSEPRRLVSLQGTGEIEVLKPLTRPEVRSGFRGFRLRRPNQPLWFRRFIFAGSGALVMIALVLLSAILVGIGDRTGGPDVARNDGTDDARTQSGELFTFDLSIPLTFVPGTGGVGIVRSNSGRRRARSTVSFAASKPRRQFRPPLQPEEPDFVPTTLVIYAENGVINTRIEPWLQAGDMKTNTFNN